MHMLPREKQAQGLCALHNQYVSAELEAFSAAWKASMLSRRYRGEEPFPSDLIGHNMRVRKLRRNARARIKRHKEKTEALLRGYVYLAGQLLEVLP